jgi:hypothetical protein
MHSERSEARSERRSFGMAQRCSESRTAHRESRVRSDHSGDSSRARSERIPNEANRTALGAGASALGSGSRPLRAQRPDGFGT